MASSSQKHHKTHKGKTRAKDLVVPPPLATGIEEVLDYSRYFSTKNQMLVFKKMFHGRPILSPKSYAFSIFCCSSI